MTPISVLILWHHHQPVYRDPVTGDYRLPWVRLHGVNAYYTMARLAQEVPELALTFNLVPSLLVQLQDYAMNDASDPWLRAASIPADSLTEEERAFLLFSFFSAHPYTMIAPFPRYQELFKLRGPNASQQECLAMARRWTTQQCRDLQVWFHLAWSSPLLRRDDATLAELERKGMRFTEEDKAALFTVHRRVLAELSGRYRALQEQGAVELSTSPFYHPILPLLVDNWVAKNSNPQVRLPAERFMWPEDARQQIQRGIDFHARMFGHPPRGLWPSEGSVSEAVVKLASDAGIVWMATDEEIFRRSRALSGMPAMPPYQPASVVSAPNVALFFRDHDLSDRIGFRYAQMETDAAVNDLVSTLHDRCEQLSGNGQGSVVTIALDGENPWEAYPDQGVRFLRALYRRFLQEPWLVPVTPFSFLERHPVAVTLQKLHPGSWINGDFHIWIGHEEDHQAWELLTRARRAVERALNSPRGPTSDPSGAMQALYAAEGSDWTWWYGEDHSSGSDEIFDELFRAHIQAVYTQLGLEVPSEVHRPIKRLRQDIAIVHQSREISAILDGRISHYFEWLGAGRYAPVTGAMRAHARWLKALAFGFGQKGLFLRVDPEPTRWPIPRGRLEVLVEGVANPIQILLDDASQEIEWEQGRVRIAVDQCIEVFIPLDKTTVSLAVALWQGESPIDRLPATGFLGLHGY